MGSPHGGVIRPVVANSSLHGLDMYWAQQSGSLGHLTRSADARRIVCRTRKAAEHALHAVTEVVQRRTLTGHPTTTRLVARKSAGCECLGCHFHQGSARRSGKLSP